jgi:hypothetical protein
MPRYHPGKLSCQKIDSLLHFSESLDINNEPRAIVWLAGRISATLVRVRHLKFIGIESLNRPGHGA